MVTKDCYVERAMERLTVTTMRLCSDLLKMDLQEKPAPAGFSMCGGLMARVGLARVGVRRLAPAVPRDFLCAIIGLSGQKCALPGCIAGVLMGQRDRWRFSGAELAITGLWPSKRYSSPNRGLRRFGPCCGGDGGGGRQLAAGCTTPRDFMRFWGWCGRGGYWGASGIVGKWRFS